MDNFLVVFLSLFVFAILLIFPGLFIVFLFPTSVGLIVSFGIALAGAWSFARFGDNTLGTKLTKK